MKHHITGCLLTLAGTCFPAALPAASLQMYPVTINFCNQESVAAVYVKNTGEKTIGAQLRVFQWQQKDHQDVLNPTGAIVISPPIATVPAGKQQLIRLILPAPAPTGGSEQSYRLLIDELPTHQAQAPKRQVRFLMRYSIPVFFGCAGYKTDLSTVHASLNSDSGHYRLTIRNSGIRHIKLSNVALVAGSQSYTLSKGLFGYVLPGSEMTWDLPKNAPAGTAITAATSDNAPIQTIPLTR